MSGRVLEKLNRIVLIAGLGVLGGFALAGVAEAATVYNCSETNARCVIRLEEGIVGDRVKVLDEKAHIIAQGHIIKRKGAYAVISLNGVVKSIRKGFPVIVNVENRNSTLQWAASFSDKE